MDLEKLLIVGGLGIIASFAFNETKSQTDYLRLIDNVAVYEGREELVKKYL